MQEKDYNELEAKPRKLEYVCTYTPVEQEILLNLPFNFGFYQHNILLAYIRAIPQPNNSFQITHWSSPGSFEGHAYASQFLTNFMLWIALQHQSFRIWTYVCVRNRACLMALYKIARQLPEQYMKVFEDQNNGLILVEFKTNDYANTN